MSTLLTILVVINVLPASTFTTTTSSLPRGVAGRSVLHTLRCAKCSIRRRVGSNALCRSKDCNSEAPDSILSNVKCNADPSNGRAITSDSSPANGTPSVTEFERCNFYYTSFMACCIYGCLPGMRNMSADLVDSTVSTAN